MYFLQFGGFITLIYALHVHLSYSENQKRQLQWLATTGYNFILTRQTLADSVDRLHVTQVPPPLPWGAPPPGMAVGPNLNQPLMSLMGWATVDRP